MVGLDGMPIGPTWQGEFFLGADQLGRDNMVRLLYGGRNSLMIGISAALVTTLLRRPRRPARRLLPRLDRQRLLAVHGHPLGLPGDPARDRARHLAGARRPAARADLDLGRQPRDPDARDRARLHPLSRAPDPRPGAVAAREGVRRGRPRPGHGLVADHALARSCRTSPRRSSSSSRSWSRTRSCSRRRSRSSAPASGRRTRPGER